MFPPILSINRMQYMNLDTFRSKDKWPYTFYSFSLKQFHYYKFIISEEIVRSKGLFTVQMENILL
jgi:hypothetical protein